MASVFNIKINEEYANLVPLLSTSEYESFKDNIKQNGIQLPIVTNQDGDILDGHHRYRIWVVDLGRPVKEMPRPTIMHFKDKLQEKLFVINVNLKRRHLNDFQKIELALKTKPILEEIAKRNSEVNLKQNLSDAPSVKPLTLGRVDQEIGKRANTSHETVRKVETILEQGDKDLIDKTRSGKTSINYAYKTVKRANDHKNVPELPRDRFDIILADPPWSYDINTRGSPDDHYNVMSDSDISKLQIPVSDNAILFLWATNPKLKEALSVMSAWGFNYKTNAVWVKDKIGTGYYFRGQHELLLVGEKGDMPLPEEKNRVASVIEAPRGKHSEKPDKVYDIIESMYPGRKYFELFSRGKARKNWTMWGNEVNNKNE